MTTFNDLLDSWRDGEIARLYDGNDRAEGKLMLGGPVWGADYVERLVEHCLPSIVSGANLAALAGKARLVLFVDPEYRTQLAFQVRGLEHKGIELRLHAIPDEVMKAWDGCPKEARHGAAYKMLGMAQDILVHAAGRQGMHFHMVQPDHCYGDGYFANLLRLGKDHEAIVHLGICAVVDAAAEEFKAYRQPDGGLIVPDRELGDIAFSNLHPRMKPFLMNDAEIPDRMPASHFLFWQGRDKLFLSSCHMNAAFLSNRLCAKAKKFGPATMDACLPALTAGVECFVPTASDGLTCIELSGPDKLYTEGAVPFAEFATRAWGQARFRDDYLWYTRQRCEIPIKPQGAFLTDEEIVRQHTDIIERLVAGKGNGAALAFAQSIWRE